MHVDHHAVHIYVHVGHRAIGFLVGFGNLTVQERCCRNFVLAVLCFFFCEEEPIEAEPEYLGDPDRLATAPTRHGPASLTPPPP